MMTAIPLGMVGGGEGAFIGAVHRIAARLDGRFRLVAGALSSDPARAEASARDLGLDRSYSDFREMARAEAARLRGSTRPGRQLDQKLKCSLSSDISEELGLVMDAAWLLARGSMWSK